MDKDTSVSFIRVIATLFIVICHIASYYDLTALSHFFDVGVPLFFIISGYLYGDKCIANTTNFLIKRYIRLEVPAIIWLLIVCISSIIKENKLPETHEVVFLILNLQGLAFIFTSMKNLFIGPWFFTNIMTCYILLAVYLKIEKKHNSISLVFDWGG